MSSSALLPGLTEEARALVIEHRWLAAHIARRVVARRRHASLEELTACAETGLVEVAARFDPSRGTPFVAAAWKRIEGAVRDRLRGDRRARRLRDAMESEAARFAQGASREDVPERSEEAARARVTEEAFGFVAARLLGATSSIASLDPESALVARQEWARATALLSVAMKDLAPRDAELLRLRYEEHLSVEDVGRRMSPSLPTSTASRYLRDALVRLGKRLRSHGLHASPRAPEPR